MISNLLQPNQKLPNIINSFAPKKTTPLVTPPATSTSVGGVGTKGGYDTAPVKPLVTTTPKTTAPLASASSPGSYKGQALTAGNDASIQAQMAKIDNPTQASAPIASTTNYVNPNANLQAVTPPTSVTPVAPTPQDTTSTSVQGLFPNVVTSLANRGTQPSPEYTQAYNDAQAYNAQLKSSLSNEADALKTNDLNPIPIGDQAGRASVLRAQYQAQQNAIGAGFTGASSLVGSANTQQGLQQSALSNAGSLASPQQYGLTTQPYNPLTNTIGGANGASAVDRAINAGNINTAQQFAGDYQTGLANLRAADGIQNQIISTLSSNPTLNSQPLSAITNLKELLSGQTSQPGQQLLAQQIKQYLDTLGLDPATVTSIASQQQGTLGQLLDSLRATAQNQVESKNPANLQGATGNSGSTGGGLYNF